jgi:hypothetical protein
MPVFSLSALHAIKRKGDREARERQGHQYDINEAHHDGLRHDSRLEAVSERLQKRADPAHKLQRQAHKNEDQPDDLSDKSHITLLIYI